MRFGKLHCVRWRRLLGVLLATLLVHMPWVAAWADDHADTLVICHSSLQPELKRWITYRRQQGHRVMVVPPSSNVLAMRREIHRLAAQQPLRHILLVGDASSQPSAVPTDYHRAQVNIHFGSSPEIASDNSYADLNDDGLPDVAIGRWPVRTLAELRNQIDKTIAYERHDSQAEWLRRINVVAGVGGFDPVIERSLEQLTRTFLTELIPSEFETRMTYANWASPYCPDPHRFQDAVLDRFNEGCLFWVYVGHGSPRNLDYLYTPTGRHRILSCEDVGRLQSNGKSPIAIFLACHTGAFDDDATCLAGDMVNAHQGPVAAICGTRVTMPYAMSLLSLELLTEYFHGDAETVGEWLRRSKCRMVEPDLGSPLRDTRTVIDSAAQWISPRADLLAEERREHLYLFHLLGDPLLRVPRPQRITLAVDGAISPGNTITVRGTAPGAGRLRLEVCYERGQLTFRPKARREYDDSPEERTRYQKDYEQTLTEVCVAREIELTDSTFSVEIEVPASARGAAQIRAFWSNHERFAVGSSQADIRR